MAKARDRREKGRAGAARGTAAKSTPAPTGDGGKKRRGLGTLGKLAWQKAAPALLLLPSRPSFRAGELAALCGVDADVFLSWEPEFPEIAPTRNRSGHRTYSRAQAERVLRIHHALLELGPDSALALVRQRLDEPLPLSMPFLTADAGEPPDEPLPLLAAPASRLSAEAVAFLREGLLGLIALCNEPADPPETPAPTP